MSAKSLLLGVLFALIWASAFASARVIVMHIPPLTALGVRFLISGLLALALARMLGQSLRIKPGQFKPIFVFGLSQNALYLGLNFIAMQWIDASLAAIIASTLPLLVAFISILFALERVTLWTAIGLIVGFGGVILIASARLEGDSQLLGIILCVIAAAALTTATLTMKSVSAHGNLMAMVGYQMLVGSFFTALGAAVLETPSFIWSPALGVAFTYTVIFPGVLATLIWFILVRDIGALRASTFHFLNPFFGVLTAYVVLGEEVTSRDIWGVVIIMAGILCVQYARISSRQREKR